MRIGIVGTGNVASHLVLSFQQDPDIELYVFSRSESGSQDFQDLYKVPVFWEVDQSPSELDLLLFCVKDDVIGAAAERFSSIYSGVLAAHTSGTQPSSVLADSFDRYGVFYPLQSFTKGIAVDFQEVPMCIYAKWEKDNELLKALANRISRKVYEVSDEQREHLHIGAVIVNNFTNFLFILTKDYTEQHQLDFNMLIPLIKETVRKLEEGIPVDNQTGPAVRGDEETIGRHLQKLSGILPLELFYGAFSDHIKEYFQKMAEQKEG